MMIQALGAVMLGGAFLLMFGMTASAAGWWQALLMWGFSVAFTAWVVGGLYLLVGP